MPGRTTRAIDSKGAKPVWAEAERDCRRSHEPIAEAHRLPERIVKRSAASPTEGRKLILPIRNKLFFKHRWLISANMIAALRRAGVDCNILLPAAVAAANDRSTSETVCTSPETSTDETLH